jgi:hypothetical protein
MLIMCQRSISEIRNCNNDKGAVFYLNINRHKNRYRCDNFEELIKGS